MSKLFGWIPKFIKGALDWWENGDIVPPIILASVIHYHAVLNQYEFWFVAAIIGFLTDLGHYRTIKSYLDKNSGGWWVVLTFQSYGFHVAFYTLGGAGNWAWVLGACVPILIFALADLSHKEKWGRKARKSVAAGQQQVSSGNSGKMRKVSAPRWNDISERDKVQIAGMSTAQIQEVYGVSDRTARNWRNWAQGNGDNNNDEEE